MVIQIILVFLIIVMILQSVAFLTLWERHVFGLTQNRLGPNKIVFSGVVQPLLDGVKLLKKEQIMIFNSNWFLLVLVPSLKFFLLLMEWIIVPYLFNFFTLSISLLFFLVVLGCSIYPFILAGITKKRKFGILGSLRARKQTISFEILFSLLLIIFMLFGNKITIISLKNLALFVFFFIFFISVLVELNRAPFDFSEGERELVSGYNVEFRKVGFVIFFLKEYGKLIFFSVLLSVFFVESSFLFILIFIASILYVRKSFPRLRYDLLIKLFWFFLLPLVINLLGAFLMIIS
jgi:NADH-ubiquinone oxidoreductase chain 1